MSTILIEESKRITGSSQRSNTPAKQARRKKKAAGKARFVADQYGRTGTVQILHIDLFYADGSRGAINVTSPSIIWGEDIETQWYFMKSYIKSQYERLGIVGYHAHCNSLSPEGEIKKGFSWHPFDLILNKEIIK